MALDYKIMGERLRSARLNSGMTQDQLAEKLNVSVAFLSRIESGKTRINLIRLNEICTITGVSESYILNGTSEDSPSYLTNDFNNLLKNCPANKRKQIFEIAKIIINE
jgi:transcriptional regulator with XRE-family HTH domain